MGNETYKLLPFNILDTGFWILCDSTKLNRTQTTHFIHPLNLLLSTKLPTKLATK